MQIRSLIAACALLGAGLAFAPAAGASGVRVAVLPVVVHAEGPEEYLRDGLAAMLASRLGLQEGVEAVPIEDASRATVEVETAREIGQSVAADFVLFGSFTHFGAGASLDLSVASVSETSAAPPREIFVHSGTLGEIIPRLSDLAQKVGRYVLDPTATPAVSAAPPPAASSDFQDALSELDSLVDRVSELEREVFVPPVTIPEEDLRAGDGGTEELPEASEPRPE
ncbi:MAG: hypothetical protein ABFS46_20425 [Myxococcota bacterium]